MAWCMLSDVEAPNLPGMTLRDFCERHRRDRLPEGWTWEQLLLNASSTTTISTYLGLHIGESLGSVSMLMQRHPRYGEVWLLPTVLRMMSGACMRFEPTARTPDDPSNSTAGSPDGALRTLCVRMPAEGRACLVLCLKVLAQLRSPAWTATPPPTNPVDDGVVVDTVVRAFPSSEWNLHVPRLVGMLDHLVTLDLAYFWHGSASAAATTLPDALHAALPAFRSLRNLSLTNTIGFDSEDALLVLLDAVRQHPTLAYIDCAGCVGGHVAASVWDALALVIRSRPTLRTFRLVPVSEARYNATPALRRALFDHRHIVSLFGDVPQRLIDCTSLASPASSDGNDDVDIDVDGGRLPVDVYTCVLALPWQVEAHTVLHGVGSIADAIVGASWSRVLTTDNLPPGSRSFGPLPSLLYNAIPDVEWRRTPMYIRHPLLNLLPGCMLDISEYVAHFESTYGAGWAVTHGKHVDRWYLGFHALFCTLATLDPPQQGGTTDTLAMPLPTRHFVRSVLRPYLRVFRNMATHPALREAWRVFWEVDRDIHGGAMRRMIHEVYIPRLHERAVWVPRSSRHRFSRGPYHQRFDMGDVVAHCMRRYVPGATQQ